ncbi:hypothetical protein [Plantactinospora endophytica]|uniref:Tetratricopeptide repeat protein n=1 Tax=Plantactinospora endophytica TaxID=673535 RepID=A0ABQ4E351_9ACTN|nr:hypothetical protein [Plantactinospora endophytica]GIG89134.1 hypothetical protein Pen02_40700 [Plantactinospora endophytica]
MSGAHEDLWRALDRVAEMPYGSGQVAAAEQLLRQADASGDEQLAFATRMLATAAYYYGGEPARSFVTFSWCLAEFDRNPRPFHQRHLHNLLWYFKHMVSGLLEFPEIPLDRTRAVLDDMERRYRDGGHSLQAVYKYRHQVAVHVGAAEEAAEWYRRWTTTPRDQFSDCAGCDPTDQIEYLASLGRYEEAVALAEPVLAGRLGCVEQPQCVLTALLLPYLHTGRREQARDAHLRAYRQHRTNIANMPAVGDHLVFCALTGNEARGLELLERHLGWLDEAPSPADAMVFSASAALLLCRLAEEGHGELTVRRRAFGDRPAQEVPVLALADELTGTARELAERFDARNGSAAQSSFVAELLAQRPIGEYLPLSATARRRPSPAATAGPSAPRTAATRAAATPGAPTSAQTRTTEPGPTGPTESGSAGSTEPGPASPGSGSPGSQSGSTGSTVSGGSRIGGHGSDLPGSGFDVPADATPEQVLDLAESAWRTERDDDLFAALAVFDERFAGQEQEPTAVARRAEFRAVEQQVAGDLAAAVAANREALALHRQVPDPLRAQVVAGRLGVLLVMSGEPGEGLPLVEESAGYLTAHGEPWHRAAAQDRLAIALAEQGRGDEALLAVDRAATEASGADDPYLVARVALTRVRVLELLDRPAEVGAAALRARDLYDALGLPEHRAVASLGYANSVDDPERAVTAYDEAVRLATDKLALPARTGRARALVAAGRPAEAVDDLVEAVALCVERGIVDGAAYLRWELADAYRRADRAVEAAEAAEEAVGELDRLGRQADADQCRHLLAMVYRSLGEDGPALALLDELADNLDGPDNLPARAGVLEEAGDLLYAQDRDNLAAQRFAAAATAFQLAGLPLDELRVRRRQVSAQHWAGDPAAALAALDVADRVASALPGGSAAPVADDSEDSEVEAAVRWERAMLADAAARALLGADRPDEALTRLHGAAAALRSIQAFGEALFLDLLTGEVLLRLDRPAEAEPLLRATLGSLPEHSDAVRRAAWLLTAALAALGRTAEADALRARYDLDADTE